MPGTAVVDHGGGSSWNYFVMLLLIASPGAFLAFAVAAHLLLPLGFLVLVFACAFVFGYRNWKFPTWFSSKTTAIPVAPLQQQVRRDRERFLAQTENELQTQNNSKTSTCTSGNTALASSRRADTSSKGRLVNSLPQSSTKKDQGAFCQPIQPKKDTPTAGTIKQSEPSTHLIKDKKKSTSNGKKGTKKKATGRYQAAVQEAMTYRAPRNITNRPLDITNSADELGSDEETKHNDYPEESSSGLLSTGYIAANSETVVYTDGITRFLHIPTLLGSDHAAFLLKKLAREFIPIIRSRGFNIYSVCEMCCCTDGARAARGEVAKCQQMKTSTGDCLGYNVTRARLEGAPKFHDVFIRLRKDPDHYAFQHYDELVNSMAHELAHCVYNDHSPGFWNLFNDLLVEHRRIAAIGDVHEGLSVEEQYGFNIYGNSSMRKETQ